MGIAWFLWLLCDPNFFTTHDLGGAVVKGELTAKNLGFAPVSWLPFSLASGGGVGPLSPSLAFLLNVRFLFRSVTVCAYRDGEPH